ncbi:MAG: elongation factor 4 [Candidatus Vogelbacteria bacterium CG10_big_fil_rev_8_21_14_0_10_45_14]|uniref:Elongation factor 4 n=1 Tax=Candidatus Vogelbacteria bacterium CG10_big_fil_rev_8_21_14_0_10_45_14 TaxID=1975042 RepID=A0A2H0RKU7_9BACT|nr:MAG: elongation factor 4 [Candidatus Vogelbacteria bacterium CG10_big_fil_rev_8_21_14_0_10_45_14]
MELQNIRNFSIIAHIDHGKSTLADRMLEMTGTVEHRKMKEQLLDSMDLERERGITIKMQPVRIAYKEGDSLYELNLIDTPGHIDFAYEVSRSLKAVEGAVLLVDATQGVQAQTISVLGMAEELGLTIIPAVNKVDLAVARVEETKVEIVELIGCKYEDICEVSGKTGQGVDELLKMIVRKVPPPKAHSDTGKGSRALVFDYAYSNHKGLIFYLRVVDGRIRLKDNLFLHAAKEKFSALEIGIFAPEMKPTGELCVGEIGYIVSGVKKLGTTTVGDTVTSEKDSLPPLPGYRSVMPVVWASLYPESQDDFTTLKQALDRLKLQDASLSFEEETSPTLGRGFRCGFLGMLHLEIISERLRREFNLELIVAMPTVSYEVETHKGKEIIYSAALFPDDGTMKGVSEPWVLATVITPPEHLGSVMQLCYEHEAEVGDTVAFGKDRMSVSLLMPLRELMRNFFDKLKSASSGFASLSYELGGLRKADVVRMDVLVADEPVTAFARVISRRRVDEEAQALVESLQKHLPRTQFAYKIQAKALGRIVASRSVSALRKDVTGYLYGGDITRKKKLLEKQKKGKKKMQERGKVNIPQQVFLKVMRGSE